MSAPAANAFSEPVMTMQPIASSASNASSAALSSRDQRIVQRIERLRAIETDDANAAIGFDENVFVSHGRLIAPGGRENQSRVVAAAHDERTPSRRSPPRW